MIPMERTILVFGDSITWGAWDAEGGWVQRLREAIDEKNLSKEDDFCALYNLGISGDSTRELLERVESETRTRTKRADEIVMIFAIGTNDSWLFREIKRHNVPPEMFRENLGKLLIRAKKFTSKLVFVGLAQVDERVDPVPWNTDKAYKPEYLKHYNSMLKEFCEENKLHFIEIMPIFEDKGKELLKDGAHPNSEGHKLIFETVKDYLEKEGIA